MKFDMGRAWSDAMAMLSNNSRLIVILAGVFLFLPSLVLGVFAPSTELEAAAAGSQEQMQAAMAAFASANWPIILFYALVSTVGTLAVLALLGREQKPTVGEAIKIGAIALVPYLAASLLMGAGIGLVGGLVVGIGAAISPAVAAILGFLVLVGIVFVIFRLVLVGPVMAIEGTLNPIEALKRSWTLVKGNTRYVAAFMILLIIALLVLTLVVGMVFGVIGALAPSGTVSTWVNAIFEGLIGAVGSTVFLAVYAAMHRQLAGESPESLSQTFD
ncbi:MAG: hypothetical protein HKP43_00540 [Altererythrobacter sp.]|nr:hypothetical protein [Altererythrobacter sp.]MBT8431006.1 hypothetical protein [Altererythrobacter sp.]NNE50330.1 hypothetical protein [Altererythrobacter sp.]NNF93173.1 hypothetical protein [Altererythrobacter sp.]NNK45100.1 hypothetical protein [Altererythrobacter sp.]